MNRIAQGLVLVLLGAASLSATLATDLYLNYVQEVFRPFLIGAGVVLVVLGVVSIAADVRVASQGGDAPEDHAYDDYAHAGHGHDHGRGPGVAWLLLLPVVAVFVIAPPPLGAYSASNGAAAEAPKEAEEGGFADLGTNGDGPRTMELQEFVMRAWTDQDRALSGREVELTGFVVPHPDGKGWYLARLQMACCAADAIVNRVLITGEKEPAKDTWWTVRGTWQEPKGELQDVRDHRFTVTEMKDVENPPDPYE
ncbi:putative repeat protein (TIGR03943 family) [Murinocardiopsis flavida]|uniref:Putative repeat protein (TIGR03943 family) n=1 Tax=Murinocardiopsis flavida TaxID=645275 RepID=A0A2P8DLQ3_9ACTN|nr:TIGR03943 family protein [Murinocardiopsis flavida]PSK98154.1 putative repeat protein (TIGR03943 family) [Murinocardiopsis flavida]